MAKRLTKAIARKVLLTIDAGLTDGLGIPEPGKMCVEAAVCYARGLPHGDHPDCVASSLNKLKIVLNDNSWWISNKSRAKGMRKLAILQLGTAGALDEIDFVRRLVPVAKDMAAHAAAYADADAADAAYAADAAAHAAADAAQAAYAAAGEAELVYFADRVADILIEMKVPAVKWLDLLEE